MRCQGICARAIQLKEWHSGHLQHQQASIDINCCSTSFRHQFYAMHIETTQSRKDSFSWPSKSRALLLLIPPPSLLLNDVHCKSRSETFTSVGQSFQWILCIKRQSYLIYQRSRNGQPTSISRPKAPPSVIVFRDLASINNILKGLAFN